MKTKKKFKQFREGDTCPICGQPFGWLAVIIRRGSHYYCPHNAPADPADWPEAEQ